MFEIAPSLPAESFTELEALVLALQGDIKEIQVDIVDGKFVAAKSWPFTEDEPIESLNKLKNLMSRVKIELDCMVVNPEQYFNIIVELGINKVILHYGSTPNLDDAISFLKEKQIEVGLAFTNDISLNEIEPYISKIDYIQIMGIAVVGLQGQPFDVRTLDTAKLLREKYPELTIAVDGSVNQETIVSLRDVGVNRFLPGSAVAKADNPKEALANLYLLLATH